MKKRVLLIVLAMVLVAALSVGLTLAYLTDHEAVTNTFTVGNVDITLDEADADDSTPNADRDKANSYKIIPGQTYTKDPTVTVAAKSEDCYVRAWVSFTYDQDADAFFKGLNSDPNTSILTWFTVNDKWEVNKNAVAFIPDNLKETYTVTYEVRYNKKVVYSESATELPAVFTEIKVPATITGEQLENLAGLQINVEAHAIQAAGFETADQAWANFTK